MNLIDHPLNSFISKYLNRKFLGNKHWGGVEVLFSADLCDANALASQLNHTFWNIDHTGKYAVRGTSYALHSLRITSIPREGAYVVIQAYEYRNLFDWDVCAFADLFLLGERTFIDAANAKLLEAQAQIAL